MNLTFKWRKRGFENLFQAHPISDGALALTR